MSIQILEDIEEAIAREVRRITFTEDSIRTTTLFKELFDPFTGELVRKPIEPQFYDEEALPRETVYPRFTIALLKLSEDLYSGRGLSNIGNEAVCVLPGPGAFEIVVGGTDLITTNGGSGNTVQLTHLRIRNVTTSNILRIVSGLNKGTYSISTILLNGNGPHTITLSNDLLTTLPSFEYTPDTGIVTFRTFVDLSAIKSGDKLIDVALNVFTITAVNVSDSTLSVAPGSFVASGVGAKINRVGDVLQGDDAGMPQFYKILDTTKPIADKGTKYRSESWSIPYTFLYYIKIASVERDDHIAIADRIMQVFNPPRGQLPTIIRNKNSAESNLIKEAKVGDSILYVEDAKQFYVNNTLRLHSNLEYGEDLVIKSVNPTSNAITVTTPVTKRYPLTSVPQVVSNYTIRIHERDFRNHTISDDEDGVMGRKGSEGAQYWIHRFTYRVEAWVDSRIPPYTTEQTFEDSGDVNFAQAVLEDFEGNILCTKPVKVP